YRPGSWGGWWQAPRYPCLFLSLSAGYPDFAHGTEPWLRAPGFDQMGLQPVEAPTIVNGYTPSLMNEKLILCYSAARIIKSLGKSPGKSPSGPPPVNLRANLGQNDQRQFPHAPRRPSNDPA